MRLARGEYGSPRAIFFAPNVREPLLQVVPGIARTGAMFAGEGAGDGREGEIGRTWHQI